MSWNNVKEKLHIKGFRQKIVYIRIVCAETGWSFFQAKKKMDQFVAEHGVDYATYVSQRFYRSSAKRTNRKLELLEKKKNEHIGVICEATGWSSEKAIKEMDRIQEKFGVSHAKYTGNRLFVMTDDEIEARLEEWRTTLKKQQEYVAKESGWDMKKVRTHMSKVSTVYDIPADYYVLYRMWELTDEEISTYARRKDSNRLFAKYNIKEETLVLKNKAKFDEVYSEYIKRKFWVNRETNYEEFLEFVKDIDSIFCKPIDSGGGQGTEKIVLSERDPEELYNYLIAKDRMLVEECVVQHPEIDKFAPGCVNTIRVVTLLKDDICHFICAGIRMGNADVVDNFHKDGMVCDVDIKTGKIITPAIDRKGSTYNKHPRTGYEFMGFEIPNWDKVLKLAEDAIRVQPGVNYVGWDIAVCLDKAVIIEGNSAPDLVLIQAPYARQKQGKRYLFEPYF